jgi:integrase/recombinase XerD
MTSHPSHPPAGTLRARMIEDMTMRGIGEKARSDYVRHVRTFSAFIGRSPDTATAEDVRRFQLQQTETGVGAPSINSAVSALRFLFNVTLDRPDLARRLTVVRQPRKLPLVLSAQEVARLIEAAPGPKYKAAFATAYGAGLRVSEVVRLRVGDVDSTRMMLRIEQGKGRRDRYAMLSPQLLALLRAWWREGRRRGVMLPQGWLFPGRGPVTPLTARRRPRRCRGSRDPEAGHAAHAPAQLRYPPAGARHRHPGDPGLARARQARHHRALHPGRHHHDPRGDEPPRPPRAPRRREAETGGLTRRPCAARAWKSPTSWPATAPPGAGPMPGM